MATEKLTASSSSRLPGSARKTIGNPVRSKVNRRGVGFSLHLVNRVTQSDQIAGRGFSGAIGRVLGKFCLIQPQQ